MPRLPRADEAGAWDPSKTPDPFGVAKMLRRHEDLILNWFRAHGEISQGTVEGLNNKAKVTVKQSCGFRTHKGIETALYQALGDLPRPKLTHEFC